MVQTGAAHQDGEPFFFKSLQIFEHLRAIDGEFDPVVHEETSRQSSGPISFRVRKKLTISFLPSFIVFRPPMRSVAHMTMIFLG